MVRTLVARMAMGSLIGFLASCSGAPAGDVEALKRCHERAQRFGAALQAQDWAAFVDLSYPQLVAKLGGKAKAMVVLRAARAKAGQFQVGRLDVKPPERIIIAGRDAIAIVPVDLELEANGKKLAGPSFFLGISSDQGKTWSFVDGYNQNHDSVRKVLPHFPQGVLLPENSLIPH